jgi:hypothetical protein
MARAWLHLTETERRALLLVLALGLLGLAGRWWRDRSPDAAPGTDQPAARAIDRQEEGRRHER